MSRIYRVLHVIDHLGPGGAQEALVSLLKYADRRRFQVEVATLYGHGHYWDLCQRLAVQVHSLSCHKFLPLYLPRLLRLCQRGKFDLLHCHLIASNLIAKPLAALAGVPVLFNHDQGDMYLQRQHLRRWLDRQANKITHHIIAVSASRRDFLMCQERVPGDKITVIYNGVDLERFQPPLEDRSRVDARKKWRLPETAPVVAGVGRLREQKNFPFFLRVAAGVVQSLPNAHFVIAGEGPEREKLEALAHRLGLASHVRFLGFVNDINELYSAVDLLLMTSQAEGTPLAVLEAMAMGVAVVGAKVDGIAEVLEDGIDGYLIPVGDLLLFTKRTCQVLQDKETAARFAQAALEKVRRRYSALVMVRKVEALYLQYLQR